MGSAEEEELLFPVFSAKLEGPVALEMLSPGGSPAGSRADGESWAATGTLFSEGVEEAAVEVTTVNTAGIDLRFKLRHGLRAARRRSTTDKVRRAFLKRIVREAMRN